MPVALSAATMDHSDPDNPHRAMARLSTANSRHTSSRMNSEDGAERGHWSDALRRAVVADCNGLEGCILMVPVQYSHSWLMAMGGDQASRLNLCAYHPAIRYLAGSS